MAFEQYQDRAIITIHSDGPRGPKGDKGDRGEKGDPGEVTLAQLGAVQSELTAHKEEYTTQIDLVLENIIINGDFSVDTDNNGYADNYYGGGINATNPRVENKIQYWTPLSTSFSGSLVTLPNLPYIQNNIYYLRYIGKNIGSITLNMEQSVQGAVGSPVGTTSIIFVNTLDSGNKRWGFYGKVANIESYLSNLMSIDLTTTFGTGNEPTKQEMDVLINLLGGWFDGTITPTQKHLANWYLKMIRQNRTAIVALGGAII